MIYLDNGATTKVDDEVIKEMTKYYSLDYGNASSLHTLGINADEAVKNARNLIAKSINAEDEEIIFTSGGTESNNLAIKGIAHANKHRGNHIITSKIEHDCILNSCEFLKKEGFEITYLNVDKQGFIDLEELKNSIKKEKIYIFTIKRHSILQ